MKLKASRNLKLFKMDVGQSNHMLITILVGLDGIIDGKVNVKEEFHTSWNPRSKTDSAERSKAFAKKSTLSWLVDSLDSYLSSCNTSPFLIQNIELKKKFDDVKNGRSVYNKYKLMSLEKGMIGSINTAFVDLLVCWRNRLVHNGAENQLLKSSIDVFNRNIEEIFDNFNGLDIERTLISFKNSRVPTFKEVASMVRATLNYVYDVDCKLLSTLNYIEYVNEIVSNYLFQGDSNRFDAIFSKTNEVKLKKIRQILQNNGFDNTNDAVVDTRCNEIASFSYKDAKQFFQRNENR